MKESTQIILGGAGPSHSKNVSELLYSFRIQWGKNSKYSPYHVNDFTDFFSQNLLIPLEDSCFQGKPDEELNEGYKTGDRDGESETTETKESTFLCDVHTTRKHAQNSESSRNNRSQSKQSAVGRVDSLRVTSNPLSVHFYHETPSIYPIQNPEQLQIHQKFTAWCMGSLSLTVMNFYTLGILFFFLHATTMAKPYHDILLIFGWPQLWLAPTRDSRCQIS